MSLLVDAHVHVWEPATGWYPWLRGELDRAFVPFDYDGAVGELGVDFAIYVQAAAVADETSWLLEHCRTRRDRAVVGWWDVSAADAVQGLLALQAQPGADHLVGVRPNCATLLSLPPERQAELLSAVERSGLALDLLVNPAQLGMLDGLVRLAPGVRFVLDHAGKPALSDEPARWAVELSALAALPNLWCKASGIRSAIGAEPLEPSRVAEYLRTILDSFGHDRVVWGSDWPVATLSATPLDDLFLVQEIAGVGSPIFASSAVDLYRLQPVDG